MKKRCFYSKHKDFKDYGGRGITVCQRWLDSFEAFLEDMGRKPSPEHSLDRKDVNGNYEPSNCRWATDIEQARNTRATVFIDFRGEKMSLMAACELAGLPWQTVRQRLGLGWPVDRALNQPVQVRKKPRRELVLKGERNGMAKLTAAQVKEIRIAYASKATTHSAIASEYGISRSSVGQIISGKSWSLT